MSEKLKTQKVLVRSFGCSFNLAEGEFMVGCLLEAGYDIVNDSDDAEVLVYNTCAVKTRTENRTIKALKKAGAIKGKHLIISGCLPQINLERIKAEVRFDGIMTVNNSHRVVDAVNRVTANGKFVWLRKGTSEKPCLDLPRRPANPTISIVPVAQGCLGSCSYCCVRFARGSLRSCGKGEVVKRIRRDLESGAKEVWLTAQDMACYGKDIGLNLADLLDEVCQVDGSFFLRVGMMTPNHVQTILPELVEAFRNEHVYKFLHLPVQSGDDRVLKRMNRFYSIQDFHQIVRTFRTAFPDLTLSTDIICGFPGESSESFERSLRLIEEVRPDVVNISKFCSRPKTSARKMTDRVAPDEIAGRSRKMTATAKRISRQKNSAWMNWTGKVLVDEPGKQPGSMIGRNFAYKPIVIRSPDPSLLGKLVDVHVTKTFQTYLEAEILD